jgi:hypothetical protein
LITSLLLGEWANHDRIALSAFWSRRARRLLPAALITLAGVSVLAPVLSSPNQLRHLRFDVLASVGYVVAVTVQVPRSNLAYANVRVGGGAVSIASAAPAYLAGRGSAPVSAPSSIMIIGDSAMFDASLAIQALYEWLGTTTVVNVSFPGFGLTRDSAEWHRTWPGLVAANRPQLVLAMVGGWDFGYVKANGAKAYGSVLDDATKVLTAAGGRILWPGTPPTDAFGRTNQVDLLMQATARDHPGASAYADPAPVLRASDGTAPRWLTDATGRLVLARKPDGWHLCPDGALRVAHFATTQVAQLGWSPAPRSGWEAGAWRNDHRYDEPPTGCDPTRPENAPQPPHVTTSVGLLGVAAGAVRVRCRRCPSGVAGRLDETSWDRLGLPLDLPLSRSRANHDDGTGNIVIDVVGPVSRRRGRLLRHFPHHGYRFVEAAMGPGDTRMRPAAGWRLTDLRFDPGLRRALVPTATGTWCGRLNGQHRARSCPISHARRATPLRRHHEQRSVVRAPSMQAKHPRSRSIVGGSSRPSRTRTQRLLGTSPYQTAPSASERMPVRGAALEVGPHPPVRQAAVGFNVERREPVSI